MKTTIEQLETEIAELKNAIQKGWAKGQEAKLTDMEAELDRLLEEDKSSAELPPKEEEQTISEHPVDGNEVVQTYQLKYDVVDTVANDQTSAEVGTELSEWSVDNVQVNADIVAQMQDSLDVVENQLPAFTEERYKNLVVLAAKATCLTKWTGAFKLPIRVEDETLAERVAHTFGLLSFDYFYADSMLNKAIKEAQLGKKYLTICSVPTQLQRDTAVEKYEEVKPGCHLVAHTKTLKRDETDKNILGQFEQIFNAPIPKNEPFHTGSTAIMGVRYKQQIWLEQNVKLIEDLIIKLQSVRPTQVKSETYKAWSGILALALLWDQTIYKQMFELMLEMVGTVPLEDKVKLACALSIVVPEYEHFMSRFGQTADTNITTTLLKTLLCSVSFDEKDISDSFKDIGLPLADNKGGLTIQALKDTYTPLLDFEDKRVQKYLVSLKRPEAATIEQQEPSKVA